MWSINYSQTLIWTEAVNSSVLFGSELLLRKCSNKILKLYLVGVDSLAVSHTTFFSEFYLRYYRRFWHVGLSQSSTKFSLNLTMRHYRIWLFISTQPCFYGFLETWRFFLSNTNTRHSVFLMCDSLSLIIFLWCPSVTS